MSDYAEAVRDWRPLDTALEQAYRPEPVYLPAPLLPAAPVVHQPVVLPERAPLRADPWVVRPIALGGFVALVGLGVDLAGQGIRAAGPYLWALAGALGALAAIIALLKAQTAAPGSGTQINISGGKNKFRDVR
ncbi:hypothetical protein [Streptacidiphilus cavernicola]|uniref:Uncharacterized protein n=1 Tax=Streptacidiphilus cavernicola TaxID=3342716 RepID=A0ABV6VXS4_9ACTN